jgi:hypothetical protein
LVAKFNKIGKFFLFLPYFTDLPPGDKVIDVRRELELFNQRGRRSVREGNKARVPQEVLNVSVLPHFQSY